MKGFFSPEAEGSWGHEDEIPNATSFEDMVELMCADPEFVAQCEKNNAEWDEEVAGLLEITVDELWERLGIQWTDGKASTNRPTAP